MDDRSHLTPVTVIDHRGRRTTVYRNLTGQQPTTLDKGGIPAAAAVAPSEKLPDPPRIHSYERTALLRGLGWPAVEYRIGRLLDGPCGHAAAALTVDAIRSGALTEKEAHEVLILSAARASIAEEFKRGLGPKIGSRLARDSMRVAVRVAARGAERTDQWAADVMDAMAGTRGAFQPPDTEVQYAGIAAVVEFAARDSRTGRFTDTWKDSVIGDGRRITSAALARLIYEQPHDLDRILAYIDEQKISSFDDEGVERLREWLDATEDPSADSWG